MVLDIVSWIFLFLVPGALVAAYLWVHEFPNKFAEENDHPQKRQYISVVSAVFCFSPSCFLHLYGRRIPPRNNSRSLIKDYQNGYSHYIVILFDCLARVCEAQTFTLDNRVKVPCSFWNLSVFFFQFLLLGQFAPHGNNSFVHKRVLQIAPEYGGIVNEVYVKDGQAVKKVICSLR